MPDALVPYFHQLLGQEELVNRFSSLVKEDRLPHAILLAGEDGGEAMPLALAMSRQILCEELSEEGQPCGHCPSCRMMDKLEHPDLTLSYPVVRIDEKTTSQDYFKSFQELLSKHTRFTESEWRDMQDAKNKQLQIMVAEAERLIKATSLRSFKSRHQVVLMWMPEMLRVETANKLLKLLEEPPVGVIFILVSHQPSKLLPTILSRLQRFIVPAIPEPLLAHYLLKECQLPETKALEYAHLAQGSLYRAISLSSGNSPELIQMERAVELLRLPMQRDPKLFLEQSKEIAALNRPEVVSLLETIPMVLREVLALSYGDEIVVYLPEKLKEGCREVAQFLDAQNIPSLMEDVNAAINEVRQNANVRIVFFDLLLNTAMLYSKGARLS